MGDVIDGISIVVTIAGICTSLGLGAIQMTAGAQRIGWLDEDLSEDAAANAQIVLVWIITAVTAVSVVSGLNYGVRYLSIVGKKIIGDFSVLLSTKLYAIYCDLISLSHTYGVSRVSLLYRKFLDVYGLYDGQQLLLDESHCSDCGTILSVCNFPAFLSHGCVWPTPSGGGTCHRWQCRRNLVV